MGAEVLRSKAFAMLLKFLIQYALVFPFVAVIVLCVASELILLAKMVRLRIPWTRHVVGGLLKIAGGFALWSALLGIIAGFSPLLIPALLRAGASPVFLFFGSIFVFVIALLVFVMLHSFDEDGPFASSQTLILLFKGDDSARAKARLAFLAGSTGPFEFTARAILAEDERRPEILRKYINSYEWEMELTEVLARIPTQTSLDMLKEQLGHTSRTRINIHSYYNGTQEVFEQVDEPNYKYEVIKKAIRDLGQRVG